MPFAAYDFLSFVVPGAAFLFGLMILFPAVKDWFGRERFDAGGLGIFVIIAFAIGHLLHWCGQYSVEPLMVHYKLAYRTNTIITDSQDKSKEPTLMSRAKLNKLIGKLDRDFSDELSEIKSADGIKSVEKIRIEDTPGYNLWRQIVTDIYYKVRSAKSSERVDAYQQSYRVNFGLTNAFLMLFIVVATFAAVRHFRLLWVLGLKCSLPRGWPVCSLVMAGLLAAATVSLWRMSDYDTSFSRELFAAYMHPSPGSEI